jgi:hypothetical protein
MIHPILAVWWEVGPEWLWHPLGQCAGTHAEVERCKSYNFHSGITGSLIYISLFISFIYTAYKFYRHVECHVEAPKNCRRIGRPVAGTGHRACRLHHPHAEEKGTGITAEDILRHHEESGA